MKKATTIIAFIFGTAIGSVASWYITKTKYEKIAQEEIDSVKEVFSKRTKTEEAETDISEERSEEIEPFIKNDIVEVNDMVNDLGYTEVKKVEAPYVISPDEFGEFEDYETISLTYYADKILADENDELVEDVEEIVGFESLGHFGEYEDDSVFVRNDRMKADYEILLDQRNYSDVIKTKPHFRMEV